MAWLRALSLVTRFIPYAVRLLELIGRVSSDRAVQDALRANTVDIIERHLEDVIALVSESVENVENSKVV